MALKNIIFDKIKSNKSPITFRDYMQMALYYPEFGYYSGSKDKISSQGDFITATSQSSLFARTFARQFSKIINELGDDTSIIEFGAGNGKFAVDCMSELERENKLPHRYIIVELSNDLRFRQKENIKKNIPHLLERFVWVNELPEKKIKAIVFANEVLDAMPVDIFKVQQGEFVQQGVDIVEDNFGLVNLSNNDSRFNLEVERIESDGLVFDDDYVSEINTWIWPWIKSLKSCLSKGVVFLCDYGYHRDLYYSKERSMGTLTCYYQHKANFDPFINIGLQDITAHVDFTAVAEATQDAGFQLEGYITQANFLKQANIAKVFEDVVQTLEPSEKLRYTNDMKDLLLNDKLAEVFKVFSFSVDFEPVLDVFDNVDNIDYLL